MIKPQHDINEAIVDKKLLVINSDGTSLGEMSTKEALKIAQEQKLDLVVIVPKSEKKKIPIAKIINYGKMIYEQQKKKKLAKKNQTTILTKEVHIKPLISTHDLQWRSKQTIDWLNQNYQIRFRIQTFGRVGYKPELINESYEKFIALLGDVAKVQTPLKKLSPVLYEALIVRNKK